MMAIFSGSGVIPVDDRMCPRKEHLIEVKELFFGLRRKLVGLIFLELVLGELGNLLNVLVCRQDKNGRSRGVFL